MKIFNSSLLLFALVTTSLSAQAKHRVGNGGHSVASHFSTIANNISRVWEDTCLNKKDTDAYCSYLKDYQNTLDKDSVKYIKVKAVNETVGENNKTDHPCKIDYNVREACNDGQNLIIVNTTKWREIPTSAALINLVLHEIFSVLDLDSSDHYEYSIKIFSMLKHKGYNLDLIATHEALPQPCSIKVNEKTLKDNLKTLLVSDLYKKRYTIRSNIETTRYEFNLATKCNEATFKVSCAVFAELTDTYTTRNIFTDMQVKSGSRTKATKLFQTMQKELNKRIDTCNI